MIALLAVLQAGCSTIDSDFYDSIGVTVDPAPLVVTWDGPDVGSLSILSSSNWGYGTFGDALWSIDRSGDDPNPIASGYRIGDVPDGTTEQNGLTAAPLESGRSYTVIVTRYDRRGSPVAAGRADFYYSGS
jgi:hypothetical protein